MQVQKPEMRDEIIKSASILFAKKGVKNTSLKNIAEKAHTTVGNIYNYFSGKEEILDVIAAQMNNHLDNFFEHRFNAIIEQIGLENLYNLAGILLIDKENYDREQKGKYNQVYDEQLVLMMEGCKGTKYEYYKDNLTRIVDNLWQEHILEPELAFLRKSISSFFVQLLLEKSKQRLRGEEIKKNGRELFEKCRAVRNDEEKTVTYILAGYAETALLYKEEFLKMYNEAIEGIDVREYTAIFDSLQVEQGNDWSIYESFTEIYWQTPFKYRKIIVSNEQIILLLQVQRGLEATNRTDYEIIVRHKVTQSNMGNKLVNKKGAKKNNTL